MSKQKHRHTRPSPIGLSATQQKALSRFAAHLAICRQCQHGQATLDPRDACPEGFRLAECLASGRDPDEQPN